MRGLFCNSSPLSVNGQLLNISLLFSLTAWPQGWFRTHYPCSVFHGKHIWVLVGVFKVLSETRSSEKAVRSPLTPASLLMPKIRFLFITLEHLELLQVILYLVVTPGKPKAWKMRNTDGLGTTVNVLSLHWPFLVALCEWILMLKNEFAPPVAHCLLSL